MQIAHVSRSYLSERPVQFIFLRPGKSCTGGDWLYHELVNNFAHGTARYDKTHFRYKLIHRGA
jgi:hypothetical protein